MDRPRGYVEAAGEDTHLAVTVGRTLPACGLLTLWVPKIYPVRSSGVFVLVLEEEALLTRVGAAETMLGQLDRLLAVMSLPRVSVGIIRANGERHCLAQGTFWIFDDDRVQIEGVSARLDITQPREIEAHRLAFELLQRSAVHGRPARQLIHAAVRELE